MVGLDALAPLQISTLRVVSGAVVVVTLLHLGRGRLPSERRAWLHLQVVGFFLCTAPFTLFALGETRVSSALAGIGNAVTPIATVVLTMLFVRDEHYSLPRLAGVVLGFVGVVVIMQPWAVHERPDLLGFAMTLAAGTCYGIGWTWHRLHLKRYDPGGLSVPAGQLVIAGLTVVDPIVAVGIGVLVLGTVGTGWAFTAQFDVVRAAGATVGTSVTYLIPVVSVLLGVLVLDEHVTAWTLVGFAFVLAGAVLIGLGNRWATSHAARRAARIH